MRRLITIGLFLLSTPLVLQGQNDSIFANRKIKQLAEALMIPMPETDTIMPIPSLINGKSIVFRYDKQLLVHIGVSIFSDENKEMINKPICNFIERFFLELVEQKNTTDAKRKLEEFHVELSKNGAPFGSKGFNSVSNLLEIMIMPVEFRFEQKDMQGRALWTFDKHEIELVFPLYREIIDGTDKAESDRQIYHLLEMASQESVNQEEESLNNSYYSLLFNNVYVLNGETFMVKNLTSNKYYLKEGNSFKMLFDKQYPEYSLSNLFLSSVLGKNKRLLITHRQYGHFTPVLQMPLVNFLNVFSDEFLTYCHAGYTRKGELEIIVVFNHKLLNYIHLLQLRTSVQELFEEDKPLSCDFYSNIPQHYIKTLIQ